MCWDATTGLLSVNHPKVERKFGPDVPGSNLSSGVRDQTPNDLDVTMAEISSDSAGLRYRLPQERWFGPE